MTTTAGEMRHDSYLIQRLRAPRKATGPLALLGDNPFAFGGGLKNGGLSDDAMGLLRDVFHFDYMGSAEFEFGAVPQALDGLAKDAETLVGFGLSIPLATVPANWRAPKDAPPPDGDGLVWVICRQHHAAEVTRRVEAFARDKQGRTKERVGLPDSLRPYNEWDGEIAGWLELDNGYLFFTSEDMWRATCALFGPQKDPSRQASDRG